MAASGILIKGLPRAAEDALNRRAARAHLSRNAYLIRLVMTHLGREKPRGRSVTEEYAKAWWNNLPEDTRGPEPAGRPITVEGLGEEEAP